MLVMSRHLGSLFLEHLFLIPDKGRPSERFLTYSSLKIKFRKPLKKEEAVLKFIKIFAERWKNAISENIGRMPHGDKVNWAEAISC